MKLPISLQITSKGVIISFNSEVEFTVIKEALINHVQEASSFFSGVDIYLNYNNRTFSLSEMQEIMEIVKNYEKVEEIYFFNDNSKIKADKKETLLIDRTIRSGQKIKYPVNIVILGDVNPGAEIIAGGNIIVFGKLRGVVHAGAKGLKTAQIIAINLEPTQLRIANIISRPPDANKRNKDIIPERAYIKDNAIIVETLKL